MASETTLAFGSLIFALVAAWFAYVGLSSEVVIATEAGEVANLQLMHIQSVNITISAGAAAVAAILAIGSAIVTAIRKAYEAP